MRGTALDSLLDAAATPPVLLERDGVVYSLSLETPGLETGYDPKHVARILDQTLGSWSDLDPDELIAQVYRARAEGSRPPTRP